MEDLLPIRLGPAFWRGVAALGGLGFFLLLEQLFRFRAPTDSKHRRFWVNAGMALLNAAVLAVLFGDLFPKLARFTAARGIGLFHLLALNPSQNILLSVVLLDLLTYFWHLANHYFPLFWRLHRVHHSDPDLDVTSAFRFHLGEILLSALLKLPLVVVLGIGFPGLIVFEASLLFAAQFQHSNLRLPETIDRVVRLIFVTPTMHRSHHSVRRSETDTNFGTIFSLWDRLVGSYRIVADQEKIVIGLAEYARPSELTFPRLLFLPFERNFRPRGLAVDSGE
jgi:sterol desaturase/sphingolipid hydroxylase (fatty acid hydroxylase superfamily)